MKFFSTVRYTARFLKTVFQEIIHQWKMGHRDAMLPLQVIRAISENFVTVWQKVLPGSDIQLRINGVCYELPKHSSVILTPNKSISISPKENQTWEIKILNLSD